MNKAEDNTTDVFRSSFLWDVSRMYTTMWFDPPSSGTSDACVLQCGGSILVPLGRQTHVYYNVVVRSSFLWDVRRMYTTMWWFDPRSSGTSDACILQCGGSILVPLGRQTHV